MMKENIKNLKCDFCSQRPITARYMAEDFVALSVGDFDLGSKGAWAACETCEKLIDDCEWNKLVDRVTNIFLDEYPVMRNVDKEQLKQHFFDLYAIMMQHGFRKGRL